MIGRERRQRSFRSGAGGRRRRFAAPLALCLLLAALAAFAAPLQAAAAVTIPDLAASKGSCIKAEAAGKAPYVKAEAAAEASYVQTGAETAAAKASSASAKTKVVVLDPGHGGKENGAQYYGMKEKNLNLKIAKYCRAALLKYKGVKVVMTRTTDREVNSSSMEADLLARSRIAKKNKAVIFVCLHNNAFGEGESSKTNGVRVYFQNNSFYTDVWRKSKQLARLIAARVAACGLKNGGLRTRYSDNRERRDPNGKRGDYYAVLYHNKTYRIPAVIVEHAFMTNKKDAAKLKKEAFLKRLGQADAAAIAEYLGLKKK